MQRIPHSLAILLVAGAMAPAAAYAWPIGKAFHLNAPPAQRTDTRITVHLYNQAGFFRDVKVGGHTYTLQPHHGIAVTAPVGTQIFAGSTGLDYHRGDVLVTVGPENKDSTVRLN